MKTQLTSYLAACTRRAVTREHSRIIAIAGSVGKSSTKHAIGVALGAGEMGSGVRASAKNYNNELGVPLTILDRPAPGRSVVRWIDLLLQATLMAIGIKSIGAHTLVLEFGTDRPGDLEYLVSIAPPDIVVMTAIGAEHTEFFGSVDKVAEEELTVVRRLGRQGIVILNADDPRVMQGRNMTEALAVTFGEADNADIQLVSARIGIDEQHPAASGLDIHIMALGMAANFRITGVFGKPQALAIAAAVAVVHALDIDFHETIERLQSFHGMPGRTRLIPGIKRTMLLDHTYNSSPLAALSAIRDLQAYPTPPEARRLVAMGDMLELGPLAHEAHAEVGRAIAHAGIDMLVVCGTLAHVMAEAAKQAGMPEERIFVFAHSPEAGLFIQEKLKQGDVVLIKGSQGSRMEKITKELMAEPERAGDLLVRQTAEWLA